MIHKDAIGQEINEGDSIAYSVDGGHLRIGRVVRIVPDGEPGEDSSHLLVRRKYNGRYNYKTRQQVGDYCNFHVYNNKRLIKINEQ